MSRDLKNNFLVPVTGGGGGGGQSLLYIFEILNVCTVYLGMIAFPDWQLSVIF